jgi:two-component system LytT family sensor kinase
MKLFPARSTVWQVLGWCAFWVLLPTLLSGAWTGSPFRWAQTLIALPGIAVVVWANLEVLLPRFYFRRRRIVLYALAGLAVLLAVILLTGELSDAVAEALRPDRPPPEGINRRVQAPGRVGMRYIALGTPFFTSFIGSALFAVAGFANRKEKEAALLRGEKLEAELKFLKSQINPHFLFNALNNVYTLTVLKSDQAPEHLLKLSAMLRYVLYDCKADRVPLHKEIEYLRHFIDLHLLKDSGGMNVRVELDESRPQLPIAPMLLVPFVENAFKHSRIEDLQRGWIEIALRSSDGAIDFDVRNSRPEHAGSKDKVGGIGLENVRRQLELLYPGRHVLEIREEADTFSVRLNIKL